MPGTFHKPVLVNEVIKYLQPMKDRVFIDATAGAGGHTLALVVRGARVHALDCDPEAINYFRKLIDRRFPGYRNEITLIRGNFRDLASIAKKHKISSVDGILFDLGMSSYQLDSGCRGFSYRRDQPLDMRMDPEQELNAEEIVNSCQELELVEIFTRFGEVDKALALAKEILHSRPLSSTFELNKVIDSVYSHQHCRAQIYQALRIAVNDELGSLRSALKASEGLIRADGIMAVVSFHSLEDRIVKLFIRSSPFFVSLIEKPLTASAEEIKANRRAMSAKLRVCRRI